MYTDTEGIILKHIRAVNGRKMVLLFSKKLGKISAAGSYEKSKSKVALALRPFTHGRYNLFKGRDVYNINSAEVIKAYYGIGEDVEKYMCASFVLELTERLLPENAQSPEMFKLVLDFFDLIELRKKKHMTLLMAYQLKAIQCMGFAPEIGRCVCCGNKEKLEFFDVKEGGMICADCRNNITRHELIYTMDFDIINALCYFLGNNLKSVEHIALDDKILERLKDIVKEYRIYHLSIMELKSEEVLNNYNGG